jgi:hypothetical protein
MKWLPIESAPRDGSVFYGLHSQFYSDKDLQSESEGWLGLPRYPYLCRWDENYYEDEPDGGKFVEVDMRGKTASDTKPAHWMPIPLPPTESNKS